MAGGVKRPRSTIHEASPAAYGSTMPETPNPWPALMEALRAYQTTTLDTSDRVMPLFDCALSMLRDIPEWLAYAHNGGVERTDALSGHMTPVQGYAEAVTWLMIMARTWGRPGPMARVADDAGWIPTPFLGEYWGYSDDPTSSAGIVGIPNNWDDAETPPAHASR
jgi:hypothetical protein